VLIQVSLLVELDRSKMALCVVLRAKVELTVNEPNIERSLDQLAIPSVLDVKMFVEAIRPRKRPWAIRVWAQAHLQGGDVVLELL
jgi:hypothetical protein